MTPKVFPSVEESFADLKALGVLRDGMTVMVGGFGLCGIPENLIVALRDSGVKELTCISNNAGVDDFGLGLLLQTRQIKKMISSYVGENVTFEKQFLGGELEIEFNPQGTLAERIRAGGAGIPAFFTATGAGTVVADGKETRAFFRPSDGRGGATIPMPGTGFSGKILGGSNRMTGVMPAEGEPREYVMETGLFADLALVKASKGDGFGNLVYNKTARNFNPMMATAAKFVIAEVDELVGTGELEPDGVHTPGSFVDRVVKTVSVKRIEQRTVLAGAVRA
jgi:3-oxoacid CoA-transferase subunit A